MQSDGEKANSNTITKVFTKKIAVEDVPLVEFMCLVFTRMPR